jgi:Domain of unknown function (DUF4189)
LRAIPWTFAEHDYCCSGKRQGRSKSSANTHTTPATQGRPTNPRSTRTASIYRREHAADQYYAVALGYVNENPPVLMAGGSSISGNQDQAFQGALTNCAANGAGHCVVVAVATNECAAAASNNFGEEVGASAATRGAAESAALGKLQNQTGAKVIVSGCSNGNTPPPPNEPPPPPPAPKQGPTVSFNKVLGGLESHITDRSGVTSQCTYARTTTTAASDCLPTRPTT